MKSIRTLGLPILGALVLLVCLGGSTASATILCDTNADPCTSEGYPAGTAIEASLTSGNEAVLTTAFATVKCTESSIEGEIDNGGGEPDAVVSVAITTLSFSGCSCGISTLEEGTIEVSWTSGSNGTLTGKNSEITVNCTGLGVSCKFGTASGGTAMGSVTGGEAATVAVEAKLPYIAGDSSSFVCTGGTGTGTLKANYTIAAPTPLYVKEQKTPSIVVRVPGGVAKLVFTKAKEIRKLEVENTANYDVRLGQQIIDPNESDFKIVGGDCKSPGLMPGAKDKKGNTNKGHLCTVEIRWESGVKATGTYTIPYGPGGTTYVQKKEIES